MEENFASKTGGQRTKPKTPKKRSKKPLMLIILLLTFFLIIMFFLFVPRVDDEASKNESQKTAAILPTPTTGPFDDMTIPYLRAKKYTGKINELSRIGANQNYTSYLTSYNSDGLKINGLLTVPNEERPLEGYPAIIFIHGYIPPTIYETLTNYSAYVDYLARNGFVVFKIDLRGHADSEGEASGAYYSGDYIVDVLNAYSALQGYEDVNPSKIGIWGHSMAGNVTLRALAAKPEIPAAVIWAGAVYTYSDMQELGIQDNSYRPPTDNTNRQRRRDQLFETYGQFSPDNPFWQKVAPTNYLNDIKGAIQLNHAVDDYVVSIEYSRGLAKLLSDSKVPHELKEYQSGGHNLAGDSFNLAMQNTVDFFNNHIK